MTGSEKARIAGVLKVRAGEETTQTSVLLERECRDHSPFAHGAAKQLKVSLSELEHCAVAALYDLTGPCSAPL